MRIAPVGLAYRNATPDALMKAVEAACQCTHVHPEAVEGAFLQVSYLTEYFSSNKATAVAKLCKITDPKEFDALALVKVYKSLDNIHYFRNCLQSAKLKSFNASSKQY